MIDGPTIQPIYKIYISVEPLIGWTVYWMAVGRLKSMSPLSSLVIRVELGVFDAKRISFNYEQFKRFASFIPEIHKNIFKKKQIHTN